MPLIFFYHWTNLVAVCYTMKHHTAYKIPLLHLLRFFSDFSDFFLSLDKSCYSLLHNEAPYCLYNPFVTPVALFFTPPLKYFYPIQVICINILRFNAAIVKKALLHLLQCYTVTKMRPSGFPLSFYAVSKVQTHILAIYFRRYIYEAMEYCYLNE